MSTLSLAEDETGVTECQVTSGDDTHEENICVAVACETVFGDDTQDKAITEVVVDEVMSDMVLHTEAKDEVLFVATTHGRTEDKVVGEASVRFPCSVSQILCIS